jgi:hypothetical protein
MYIFLLACSRVKQKQPPKAGGASAAYAAFMMDNDTDDEDPLTGMQGLQKRNRYVCISRSMCACVLVWKSGVHLDVCRCVEHVSVRIHASGRVFLYSFHLYSSRNVVNIFYGNAEHPCELEVAPGGRVHLQPGIPTPALQTLHHQRRKAPATTHGMWGAHTRSP